MRIEEALEKFLIQLQADGRSSHTIGQYRRHVRLLAAWAHDVGPGCDEIKRLGHEDVARFLAAPVATGRAGGGVKKATSANCLRSSLRCFLGYLHGAGYLPYNPGRLIRRARCSPPPPRAISEEDQRRLLETLEKAEGPEASRDYMLFHLMLSSGIRLGSAVALDLEDLNLDKSEIRLRTAKGDAPDTIYLGQAISDHMRRFIDGRKPGALFAAADGERLSTRHVQRRFGEWIRKAGITAKVSTHSTRHAFAMKVYSRTNDVLIVKEALRHRSIASTMVYAKVNETRLRQALA